MWQGCVAAVPTPADAGAFSYRDAVGALHSLTFDLLAEGIKHLVGAVGLDPARYSTHSPRRGGATWVYKHQVHTLHIKATGDWRSDAYEAYLTLGQVRSCSSGFRAPCCARSRAERPIL